MNQRSRRLSVIAWPGTPGYTAMFVYGGIHDALGYGRHRHRRLRGGDDPVALVNDCANALARYFGRVVVEVGGGLAVSVEMPKCWCMQAFQSGRRDVEVTYLWVAPSMRGNGVGKILLDQLLQWADGAGVRVHLWVKPFSRQRSPHGLAAWYAAEFGFRPLAERVRSDEYTRVRMVRP